MPWAPRFTARTRRSHEFNAEIGVPIGSGSIESLRSQFQNRLKRTGQFWTKEGFAAILRVVVRYWNKELVSPWQAPAAA